MFNEQNDTRGCVYTVNCESTNLKNKIQYLILSYDESSNNILKQIQ